MTTSGSRTSATPVRQAVGRREAAALDRARADRQPQGRDPRRAHDRPRPAGQARHVAAHRGRPRERRDRDPRHPLHGGGRAPRGPDRADPRGRVVALDTPAGIVSMVDPEQRLRFRRPPRSTTGLLTDLPEVRSVRGRPDGRGLRHRQRRRRPSPRSSRATRSSPTSCGSNRRASTTRSSPSPVARPPASPIFRGAARAHPQRDPAVLPRARRVARCHALPTSSCWSSAPLRVEPPTPRSAGGA